MKNVSSAQDVLNSEKWIMEIKEIIEYKLGIQEDKLHDEALFQDGLGVDSLDLIELEMEIEKKFGIAITDEEAENITTVDSLLAWVKGKIRPGK